MKLRPFRFTLFLLTACILFIGPIAAFYIRYEVLTDRLEKDMGYAGGTANAIKHAYAASDLYRALRITLPPESAEQAVLRLGTINEHIERVSKWKHPDTAREVMKDMHNNLAGVAAMQWRETGGKGEALPLILYMADHHLLVTDRRKNPLFSGTHPEKDIVVFSEHWLRKHREKIKGNVTSGLSAYH